MREPGVCHLDLATSTRPPPYSLSQGQGHYHDNNNTSIANILISRSPSYDAGRTCSGFRPDPPPGGCHTDMTRFPFPRATPLSLCAAAAGQAGCGPPLSPAVAVPWKEPWSRHAPWLQDPVSCTSWQQTRNPPPNQTSHTGGHGALQRHLLSAFLFLSFSPAKSHFHASVFILFALWASPCKWKRVLPMLACAAERGWHELCSDACIMYVWDSGPVRGSKQMCAAGGRVWPKEPDTSASVGARR